MFRCSAALRTGDVGGGEAAMDGRKSSLEHTLVPGRRFVPIIHGCRWGASLSGESGSWTVCEGLKGGAAFPPKPSIAPAACRSHPDPSARVHCCPGSGPRHSCPCSPSQAMPPLPCSLRTTPGVPLDSFPFTHVSASSASQSVLLPERVLNLSSRPQQPPSHRHLLGFLTLSPASVPTPGS